MPFPQDHATVEDILSHRAPELSPLDDQGHVDRRAVLNEELHRMRREYQAWVEEHAINPKAANLLDYRLEPLAGYDTVTEYRDRTKRVLERIQAHTLPWEKDPMFQYTHERHAHIRFLLWIVDDDTRGGPEPHCTGWTSAGVWLKDVFRGNVSELTRQFGQYVAREAKYAQPYLRPTLSTGYSRSTVKSMVDMVWTDGRAVEYLVSFADKVSYAPGDYMLPPPVPDAAGLAAWMKDYARTPWWRDVLQVSEVMSPSQFQAFAAGRSVKQERVEALWERAVAFRARVVEAVEGVAVIIAENAAYSDDEAHAIYVRVAAETQDAEKALDAAADYVKLRSRGVPWITPTNLDPGCEGNGMPSGIDACEDHVRKLIESRARTAGEDY